MQLPMEDQFLLTRTALLERIRGLLGGRAAEELVFSEVTTGAENDLERATTLARQMVAMFGMSKRLGLVHCAQRPNTFLAGPNPNPEIDCSDETAREIDREVKEILDESYVAAKDLINQHRDQLDRATEQLLKDETLDAATFHRVIGVPLREAPPPRPRIPVPVPDIEIPAAAEGSSHPDR
jgi:cell division protease FtsH